MILLVIVFLLLNCFTELFATKNIFLSTKSPTNFGVLPFFINRFRKSDKYFKMEANPKAQRHHDKSLELYEKLFNCNDSYINKHITKALSSLSDALRLYGPEQVLSSYNGGKDADVTMHLLRAAVAKYSRDKGVIYSPKLIYFAVDDDFEEVLEHISNTENLFDLEVQRYHCGIVEV